MSDLPTRPTLPVRWRGLDGKWRVCPVSFQLRYSTIYTWAMPYVLPKEPRHE